MSAEDTCLALRLEGPMQAYGTSSAYNYRRTDIVPSRSAVLGMICAALGYSRGSRDEHVFLEQCKSLCMTVVTVPRRIYDRVLPVRRLKDYHTVQGTCNALGTIRSKNGHILSELTYRHYLTDVSFLVFLSGDRGLLIQAARALEDPVWGIWLGRKCCAPTAPVYAGLYDSESDAMKTCLPKQLCTVPLEELTLVTDSPDIHEGNDTVWDVPECFASNDRRYTVRRVVRKYGKSAVR